MVDGSELDEDGIANGIIVDPIGLASPSSGVLVAPNSGLGCRTGAPFIIAAIVGLGILQAWRLL